ncbi:glycosyltransferase [Vibrio cionasavignyae]|uniref:glycosyltransferase n=1 Tax=Vibrio cionasavignyae TaxID=2910252 RepID=UPI003D0E5420
MNYHYIHIITNFSDIGGAELMLIKAINASGIRHRHTIVSLMRVSDELKSRIHQDVEFFELKSSNALDLLRSALLVKRIISNADSINAVYSWMYHANFVGALAKILLKNKIRLIWGVRHSLDDFKGEKLSTKLAIIGGKLISHVPDKIVYCSIKSKAQHCDFGYGSHSKSVYIPNGYDLPVIKKRDFEKRDFVFGAAGRFHDAKDYYILFKAMAPVLSENPLFSLRIAGRGMTNDNVIIQGYIKKLEINSSQVYLLGQQDDMNSFYQGIDFFILTSKTEGFPNVLAESSGFGCISFSTRVGDSPEIIDRARIVEVGDATSLTRLLFSYLRKESSDLSLISYQSQLYIKKRFSIDQVTEKLFSLRNN